MKFIEILENIEEGPRPIEEKEFVRITITPRGKKLFKRAAITTGASLGIIAAVGLNRSIKARNVARTIADAAAEVREEVVA